MASVRPLKLCCAARPPLTTPVLSALGADSGAHPRTGPVRRGLLLRLWWAALAPGLPAWLAAALLCCWPAGQPVPAQRALALCAQVHTCAAWVPHGGPPPPPRAPFPLTLYCFNWHVHQAFVTGWSTSQAGAPACRLPCRVAAAMEELCELPAKGLPWLGFASCNHKHAPEWACPDSKTFATHALAGCLAVRPTQRAPRPQPAAQLAAQSGTVAAISASAAAYCTAGSRDLQQ